MKSPIMKPQILGSIRMHGRRFRAGDEAELQSVLTAQQHDDFQARGLIEGEWDVSVVGEGGSTPGGDKLDSFAAEFEKVNAEHEQRVAVLIAERDAALAERDEARAELDALKSAPVLQPGALTPPLAALESLGSDVVESLTAAGYDTPDAVAAASDKDLEALPGIGEATIKKIRALLK
jgi:hypothetical protein